MVAGGVVGDQALVVVLPEGVVRDTGGKVGAGVIVDVVAIDGVHGSVSGSGGVGGKITV